MIVAIDGKKVNQPDEVSAAINGRKPGDVISIEVMRNGKRETLKVTLGTRPTTASSGTTTTPTTPSDPTNPGGGQTDPRNPLNPGPDQPQTPGQP